MSGSSLSPTAGKQMTSSHVMSLSYLDSGKA